MKSHITLRNLSKKFASKVIFSTLCYQFEQGSYCISGPNGSGKSTLLKLIAGGDSDFSGDICVNNLSLKKQSIEFKRQIAYAPDKLMIYPFLTGREFLNFIIGIRKLKPNDNFKQIVQGLNIEQFLSYKLSDMSLGNQKKFMLAAALIANTKILLLDEPTNELDQQSKHFLIDYLLKYIDEKNILLYSSHDSDLITLLHSTKFTNLHVVSSNP